MHGIFLISVCSGASSVAISFGTQNTTHTHLCRISWTNFWTCPDASDLKLRIVVPRRMTNNATPPHPSFRFKQV
jgi:hypothetical protein